MRAGPRGAVVVEESLERLSLIRGGLGKADAVEDATLGQGRMAHPDHSGLHDERAITCLKDDVEGGARGEGLLEFQAGPLLAQVAYPPRPGLLLLLPPGQVGVGYGKAKPVAGDTARA